MAWTTASDWTVQNFHSLMLMEKTWQSYSLKYRPTFLALRASNCMCFLPLKVSGKLYSLSFGESWASQEELDFHLQTMAPLMVIKPLRLSASWEQPLLLTDNTEAGRRIML